MNWFEIVNKATRYIEDNITGDLELVDIAKECNVSYYYFSKIFSMLTGYGLKEYIRNRRITLASYEISHTDARIIDIAFKYGYSSNESFSRAFKAIHGINPSQARKDKVTVYTHFPILTYQVPDRNLISLRYDIVENIDFTFVGKNIKLRSFDYLITEKDQSALDKAIIEELHLSEFFLAKHIHYKILHNLSKETNCYDYMSGFAKGDLPDIEGLSEIKLHINKAIRFVSTSLKPELLRMTKDIIYDEWTKNGYKIDGVCEIEYSAKDTKGNIDFYYLVSIK